MKHWGIFYLSLLVILSLFFAACSGRPTDSIQRTEQARTAALAERAELFGGEYWSTAEKTMQEANAKLDAKDWREAGNLLLKAKTNYTKAKDLAQSKREQLIKEVTGRQTTTDIRLKKDLLDSPLAAKLPPARKKEFDARVKEIQDSNALVGEHLKNGKYTEAELLSIKTLREVFDTQQEFLKK